MNRYWADENRLEFQQYCSALFSPQSRVIMLNNIVDNIEQMGSKTLLNAVFISLEQVAHFLQCMSHQQNECSALACPRIAVQRNEHLTSGSAAQVCGEVKVTLSYKALK